MIKVGRNKENCTAIIGNNDGLCNAELSRDDIAENPLLSSDLTNTLSEEKQENEGRLSCDKHPEAEVIEDYRFGEMCCSECGKMLLDYTPYIPENQVIGNNDVLSNAEPSRDGITENPLMSLALTNTTELIWANTLSGPSSSTAVTICSKKEKMKGFYYTLDDVYDRIEIVGKKLDGSKKVIDLAKYILCKNVHYMQKMKRWWPCDNFAGACLYAAFLLTKFPRTLKEIQSVSNTSSLNAMSKCYDKIAEDYVFGLHVCRIKTKDIIHRFGVKLRLPKEVINTALNIETQARNVNKIRSHFPDSIAAAVIYMATQRTPDYRFNVKEVAHKCCISVSTIRKISQNMENNLLSKEVVKAKSFKI